MFDPNLLVASGHVIDINVLGRRLIDVTGDYLAKKLHRTICAGWGAWECIVQQQRSNCHWVVLTSCLCWFPCAGWGLCWVSIAACWRGVVVGLFFGSIYGSSSGRNVVGLCEAWLLGPRLHGKLLVLALKFRIVIKKRGWEEHHTSGCQL